jgi:hypothetical protein
MRTARNALCETTRWRQAGGLAVPRVGQHAGDARYKRLAARECGADHAVASDYGSRPRASRVAFVSLRVSQRGDVSPRSSSTATWRTLGVRYSSQRTTRGRLPPSSWVTTSRASSSMRCASREASGNPRHRARNGKRRAWLAAMAWGARRDIYGNRYIPL